MTRILTILCVLLLAVPAMGADFYVSQNGSGITNSLVWLNTSANWNNGTGTIRAGDTVHLVGTLTNGLAIGGSGAAGNPITILFDPNAKFSAPTLAPNSFWINLADHVVIDGGVNGRIELTDNGTPAAYGGTFDYNNGEIWAIYGGSGNHVDVTIKNLTIAGIYVRQTVTDPGPINDAVETAGIFSRDSSGMTVSNCFISDVEISIYFTCNSAHQSNVVVSGCTLTNYAWGLSFDADGNDAMFDNLIVTNNYFGTGDAWEQWVDIVQLHRNSCYIRYDGLTSYSGRMSNIVFACNYIKCGETPRTTVGGSGGLNLGAPTANLQRMLVYNNIAVLVAPLVYSGATNATTGAGPALCSSGDDSLLANNTVIGWTNSGGIWGGSGINTGCSYPDGGQRVYNNINISGYGNLMGLDATIGSGLPYTKASINSLLPTNFCDYNIYNYTYGYTFAIVAVTNGVNMGGGDTFSADFPTWQSDYPNMDQHSTNARVQLGANYAPLTNDTVAIGKGTNLTAYAIAHNIPGLSVDYSGNPRPTTGNWTIGAYNAGTISPPTDLRVYVPIRKWE
jgi:hypothetical protein